MPTRRPTTSVQVVALLGWAAVVAGCLSDPAPRPEIGPEPEPPAEPGGHAWPSLSEDLIRPGARLGAATGMLLGANSGACTANFVFQSTNGTFYIGTAAHCALYGPGQGLEFRGQSPRILGNGTVVYHSIAAMNRTVAEWIDDCSHRDALGDSPDGWNDFALVRVDDEARRLVHPAVRGWGGPVGMASGAKPGDVVNTYGNSYRREYREVVGPTTADARTGLVSEAALWYTIALFAPPNDGGDSGGPVLLDDGRAVATANWQFLTSASAPPGSSGLMNIAAAVEFMVAHGGPAVDLVTWQGSGEG